MFDDKEIIFNQNVTNILPSSSLFGAMNGLLSFIDYKKVDDQYVKA